MAFPLRNKTRSKAPRLRGLERAWARFEPLEDRRMLHALSTGIGDGSLNMTVDGYGSFGYAVLNTFDGATYDPIGPIAPSSTTFASAIAVRAGSSGPRSFLSTGFLGTTGGLADPGTTGTNTSATSNFTVGNFSIELTQTVSILSDTNGVQTGSFLTQSYVITNNGASSSQFEIVRYIDGDLLFDGTLFDGGGQTNIGGSQFLFETDAGGTGATSTTFVGIDAQGGTIPATGRYEVDAYSGLQARINLGTALDQVITGDNNGDGFVDPGNEYDITLALLNQFNLAPGAQAVYTTRTVFGSGQPGSINLPTSGIKVSDASAIEGDSGLNALVFTVTLAQEAAADVTVVYKTVDGTAQAPGDYIAQTGTLTFTAHGATSQNVTVQMVGDLVAESNETMLLKLSDAVNSGIEDAEAVGTILNDDIDVAVGDVTLIEGNNGTRDAVFTISALNDVGHDVSVGYTTLNGTAKGGPDYLARGGMARFTPSENQVRVTVPVIGDRLDEEDENFYLFLTGPQGVRIVDGLGMATIIDDDVQPTLYVNDAQVSATSPGVVNAVFTVALDTASGREVTVNYYTAAAGAIDGIDYTGQTGILTFAPGVTTQTISVPVWIGGDYAPNKRFYLNLVDPLFAGIADAQGLATIVHGQAPKPERIIDNGDLGYSTSPGWSTLTNTQAYQLDYDYLAAGNGSGWATWTFPNIAPGTYQVLTRWAPFSNRATNAPFTLLDGGSSLGTVNVNERLAPVGDVTDGIAWQSLGFFTTNTGTLTVRLNNNANGYVVADAIRLVAGGVAVQSPEIDVAGFGLSIPLGDGSPMFEDGTDFGTIDPLDGPIPRTFTIANNGGLPLHLTGTPRVSISGPNASDFSVSIQPPATIGAGQQSTFEIHFDPSEIGLRMAQVTIANDDDSEHPYVFTIQGHGAEPGPSQFILDDVDAETTGAWSQGSNEDAYQGGSRTLPAGNGNNQMVWEFGGLASGIYDIFATWDAGPSRATNAPFTVTDGFGSTYTLFVNQQLEPRILRDGTLWGSLGMLQVTGGIVRVTLSDNSNGLVEGDAVIVVRRGGPPAAQFAHNIDLPQDVNGDNRVSPADLLMVINNLTAQGAAQQQIASGAFATPQVVSFDTASGPTASPLVAGQSGVTTWLSDVNADGAITPRDALLVINYLLASASARPQASPAVAVDDSQGAAAPLAAAAPEDLSKLVFVATDLALGSLNATTATDWKLDVADATPTNDTSASVALLVGSPAATGEDDMDDAENDPVADDLDLLSDLFAG